MTSPAYNGAGSLFVVGLRVTKLAEDGSPLVGPENSYVTDALIRAETGLEYQDGEEISQVNGAGIVCLAYRAPDSLLRGTVSSLQVCKPDPYLLEFLQGGRVLQGEDDNLGYAAPAVGADPVPNGVSLEMVTNQIVDGAKAGYFWWTLPRAALRTTGGWVKAGSDPMLPEFEGQLTQNPNWGDGPQNDWEWPSDRVWQYMQTDTNPLAGLVGLQAVDAELTTTSVEVTPPTDSIAEEESAQLTAAATMSDLSIRDVTQMASWVSATPSTVTVDSEGVVTGQAAGGPVNVTATYGGQTDASAITVT